MEQKMVELRGTKTDEQHINWKIEAWALDGWKVVAMCTHPQAVPPTHATGLLFILEKCDQ
jgi:hypothetical protein